MYIDVKLIIAGFFLLKKIHKNYSKINNLKNASIKTLFTHLTAKYILSINHYQSKYKQIQNANKTYSMFKNRSKLCWNY